MHWTGSDDQIGMAMALGFIAVLLVVMTTAYFVVFTH
jgi:hypothetical protein